MRCLAVLFCIVATSPVPVAAQDPFPLPAESAGPESTPPPAEPTPEQKRFLDGLRTASRGVAQLKDGIGRVTRAQASGDSASQRRAGRFLSGLCGSARGFIARGRPRMQAAAYPDSTGLMAQRLVAQLDALIKYVPTCEQEARKAPTPVATDLGRRMKAYDAAHNNFRLAIGLPAIEDSSPKSRRQ